MLCCLLNWSTILNLGDNLTVFPPGLSFTISHLERTSPSSTPGLEGGLVVM